MRVVWGTLIASAALAACRAPASPVGPARYANAPAVWLVNDRANTPRPPAVRVFQRNLYHFDSFYLDTKRKLVLVPDQRARGINALDEVPDSTWFTNRVGRRELTPDEIRRGPGTGEAPDRFLPWTIERAKSTGVSPGFWVRDARGERFLLKFDQRHAPEVETGADAVTSRLLWAAGYNVPEDHVVYFRRADLRLAPDAYTEVDGRKRRIDQRFLDERLSTVARAPDGRIRGLASLVIPGIPLGGWPRLGVRADDPNDRIPHELRRDQRGAHPLFAWLGHTDIKEDNTLDLWQQDPDNPHMHYVVHYLIDFGNSLGAQARVRQRPYLDYQYDVDLAQWYASLVSLGIHRQAWEGRPDPQLPGIGLYGNSHYDPARWKPNTFAQFPMEWSDRIDRFWGSKILIKFTRAQLEAAVAAGRYSDPRSARYLLDTLVARQRTTARTWFSVVNPLDDIAIDHVAGGPRLCFTDLALAYRLETAPTRFDVRAFDAAGRPLAFRRAAAPSSRGRACVAGIPLAPGKDGYTILRVDTSRGMPGTLVHVAREPKSRQARVIGIYRL